MPLQFLFSRMMMLRSIMTWLCQTRMMKLVVKLTINKWKILPKKRKMTKMRCGFN
ncbi:hypothetical protein E2C01_062056 [Portunus trituberculatus]|uniref:Uncharacterized protein n=1 Tax=Portunus trituberculatus TaxID=210409 RepID=A0A5B7H6X2_PORTR|nr:hypothetical protein [Portunus trituberculatus]